MDKALQQKLEDACWAAKSLFDRNKATGSSANMSFRHGAHIFITASGACFGRLMPEDFAEMTLMGDLISAQRVLAASGILSKGCCNWCRGSHPQYLQHSVVVPHSCRRDRYRAELYAVSRNEGRQDRLDPL